MTDVSIFTILAIDTSCDDTSVAIAKGRKILINAVSSQIEMHKKTGGVVPIDAARAHDIKITPLLNYALKKIKLNLSDIDAFAVTYGPGLAPALEVGIRKAKELALEYKKPLIPVNHMAGHLYANWAQNSNGNNGVEDDNQWPKMALLVSGNHSEIILMKKHHDFQILGETLDDACGECFDKVGRMLGLGYPGGPVVEKLAENGDDTKYDLPRPMQNTDDFNVSYSGLKTASFKLIKTIAENKNSNKSNEMKAPPGTEVFNLSKKEIEDVCASFQKAAVETILIKLDKALNTYKVNELVLGGGVIKNKLIRKQARKIANKYNIKFHYPADKLIQDNAAMIAIAGFYQYMENISIKSTEDEINSVDRKPGLRLS